MWVVLLPGTRPPNCTTLDNRLYMLVLLLQEEVRIAKESLQRTEEAADLIAEKSMIAEQEAMLLQQKATEAENELQVFTYFC